MEYGGITIFLICLNTVYVVSLGYAWFQVYRLWRRHFYRKPISGVYQILKLIAWLLYVVLVGLFTRFFLWLYGI